MTIHAGADALPKTEERAKRLPVVRHFGLMVVVAFVLSATTGCSKCFGGLNDTAKNATTLATDVLQDGIDKIGTNLSSWQTVLQDMVTKLTGDAQSSLRNEVTTLLQGSIAVANSSLQCDVDFIGHRVIQTLQRMLAKVRGKPAPDTLAPSVCSDVPSGIEYTAWQQSRIPKVDIYGYDFDAGELTVSLLTGTSRADVTSRLSKVSNYNLAINLGGSPGIFDGQQQKLQLVWKGNTSKPISEIPVLLPVTPVCQTRKVTLPAIPPITYNPPKVGGGDNDFDGNGPQIWTQVSLSVVGGSAVNATIFMRARETTSDWTEASGSMPPRTVFNVEPGWRIDRLLTPSTSALDVFTSSGHALQKRNPGPPCEAEEIQGDTDGDDIGRTGTTVHFTTVEVWEVQSDHCLNPNSARELLRKGGLPEPVRARLEDQLKEVPKGFLRALP